MVYELEPGKTKVEKFVMNRIRAKSIIKEAREVSVRCDMLAGKQYVIVVSTQSTEEVGKFYLSLYFDQKMRDVNVKRIDEPRTKCMLFIEDFNH